MSLPRITRHENCLYLTQDIVGMSTYERAKAIVSFCDKETKNFEKEIDKVILDIFEKNGVNIPNTDKSVLKKAFAYLKANNKDIKVNDIYESITDLYNAELIKQTKLFTIWLEDDRYLQCGVEVEEKDIEPLFKRMEKIKL